jgi:hypothetical protein
MNFVISGILIGMLLSLVIDLWDVDVSRIISNVGYIINVIRTTCHNVFDRIFHRQNVLPIEPQQPQYEGIDTVGIRTLSVGMTSSDFAGFGSGRYLEPISPPIGTLNETKKEIVKMSKKDFMFQIRASNKMKWLSK